MGRRILYFGVALCIAGGCVPSSTSSTLSIDDRQRVLEELENALTDTQSPVRDQRTLLLVRIEECLRRQRDQRALDSSVNAAWQIMHGVVCYGTDLEIVTPDRGRTGALDYAFHGGIINGFELSLGDSPLPATGRTGVRARVEPGGYVGQGHPDQWLAICAMSDVPVDTEIFVAGESRTLVDWCRQAQWDVSRNLLGEYSWTLIALTHYLPNEPAWMAADGMRADWELLVDAELTHDLDTSPCGGTHRLAGLVRALSAKQRLGLPDSEVWSRAQRTVDASIANTRSNRSSDGSLSSYYFVRPSKSVDLAAELASSGHLFEFLALALPEEELQQPWVQLAATRILEILEQTREVDMECGALYHALNGLKMYRDRMLPNSSAGNQATETL